MTDKEKCVECDAEIDGEIRGCTGCGAPMCGECHGIAPICFECADDEEDDDGDDDGDDLGDDFDDDDDEDDDDAA